MQSQLKISIISRNEIEGHGLLRILSEQSFSVDGVYRTHLDIPRSFASAASDVASLVIIANFSGKTNVETCRYIRTNWPSVKIVVMAQSCKCEVVAEAFRAGADGYVSNQTSCASLAEMLKLVTLGEKIIPSEIVFDLVKLNTDRVWSNEDTKTHDANVSEREIEILRLLIRGEPNKVIARHLEITEATVKVHVKSILRKLNVMNRTQAAIWALSRGITDASPSDGASPKPYLIAAAGNVVRNRAAPFVMNAGAA